jgi:hypothetical protein
MDPRKQQTEEGGGGIMNCCEVKSIVWANQVSQYLEL